MIGLQPWNGGYGVMVSADTETGGAEKTAGVVRPSVTLCYLGLALVIAASTSTSLFVGDGHTTVGPVAIGQIASAVRLVVFLVCAFVADRLRSLTKSPLATWGAGALFSAGTILVLFESLGDAGPTGALLIMGHIGAGTGYALLYLAWIELYARMDLPHALVYLTLVNLVSAAVSFVLSLIESRLFVAGCLVLMPLLSAWMLRMSLTRSIDTSFMQGETLVDGWTFPLLPVILLAVFTFANGFVRRFLANDLQGLALVGVVVASVLMFALAGEVIRRGLRPLYALSFPLIVAGSMCALVTFSGFGAAGAVLTNAAYTLFSIYTTVLLCSISFRYGVNPLWLFGYALAAINAGSLLSRVMGPLVAEAAGDANALVMVIGAAVVVLVCLYVAFDNRSDGAEDWGIRIAGDAGHGEPGAGGGLANVEEACARLARRCGLTRREEEIAVLLVQGIPFAEVEERLCISNSTLKTHARHIYAKTGVSRRSELAELVARG